MPRLRDYILIKVADVRIALWFPNKPQKMIIGKRDLNSNHELRVSIQKQIHGVCVIHGDFSVRR